MSEHGTSTMYINKQCRCPDCKRWTRDRSRARREQNSAQRIAGLMPDHVHGVNGYREWGCRCELCREAIRTSYKPGWSKKARQAGRGAPVTTLTRSEFYKLRGTDA